MRSSPSCSRSSEVFVAGEGSTRIDIRSIWFLLLYASEFLQRLTREDRERLLRGERDNDLLDALADVLAERVERRVRTMLAHGYRRRIEPLTRVRGRIEHLGTARGQLMQSGRVLCRYDEQKVDLPRYRSMLVTLRRAARRAVTGDVRRRCLSTAQMLERSGVSPVDPTPAELAKLRLLIRQCPPAPWARPGHLDMGGPKGLAVAERCLALVEDGVPMQTLSLALERGATWVH